MLLAGKAHNLAAADQLAREVACMANTPGGGALVVGVEDSTGALLGASMDPEWLKQRIHQRVDVAPAVAERYVAGARLLVVLVAEAREPVEDQDGKLRWRTGGTCQPVDRAEWWPHRQNAAGTDPMAAVTERTVADVPAGAVVAARRFLGEGRPGDDTPRSTSDLLTWLGVLRPDGHLTQAGALDLLQERPFPPVPDGGGRRGRRRAGISGGHERGEPDRADRHRRGPPRHPEHRGHDHRRFRRGASTEASGPGGARDGPRHPRSPTSSGRCAWSTRAAWGWTGRPARWSSSVIDARRSSRSRDRGSGPGSSAVARSSR